MLRKLLISLFFVTAFVPVLAHAQTNTPTPSNTPTPYFTAIVTYIPTADSYVQNIYPTSNFGTSSEITSGKADPDFYDPTYYCRTLYLFNLSSIPSGATILSASLGLYGISDQTHNSYLYRITSSWAESTATWNLFPSFNTTSLLFGYHATPSVYAWKTFTGTNLTSTIQSWVNGTYTNYGLAMMNQYGAEADGLYVVNSRENGSNKPYMYVYYTYPITPTSTPTSTPTNTPTMTPTNTRTNTPTPSNTPTAASATSTPLATWTAGPVQAVGNYSNQILPMRIQDLFYLNCGARMNYVVSAGTPTPTVYIEVQSNATPIFQVKGTGITLPLTNSGKFTTAQNMELEAGGGGSIIAKLGDKVGAQKLKVRDTNNVDVGTVDSDGNARFVGRVMVGTPTGTPTPGTIVSQYDGTFGGVVIGAVPTWISQP